MRRIPALLTAAIVLTGCSTATSGEDNRPTRAPAESATTGPAVDCFTDVSEALLTAWGVMSGQQPSGVEEDTAMGEFYIRHEGQPEVDIYEEYSKYGVRDITKASSAGEELPTPTDVLATYVKSLKLDCIRAHSG